MTAPPSPDLPLGQRLAQLVQTLQFAWFTGHVTLLFCIFRYSLSWIRFNTGFIWAQIAYRLAFAAATLTYGIVVYKTWRARQKTGQKVAGGLVGYLSDENIQYLFMSLVWLFMPPYMIAPLPYGIYSIFHVATYTRANLIPTFVPQKKLAPAAGVTPATKPQHAQHPLSDAIGAFVKQYYDTSMLAVSFLEITTWVWLLCSAILFQNRSWVLLGIYTAFLRSRFAQSVHVQNSFGRIEARIDHLVGIQGTPPVARKVWDAIKGAMRQFNSATDVKKYMNGATAPKKTS